MRKRGEEKPVIAYGAAKFNPNSKSELSAPTTFLSKRCAKHYPTIYVDEYNTTKVCHGCDEKLCPILKRTGEDEKREIRGLRWCSSTKCRTLVNRDLNAALNILRCFRSGTKRPNSLSRNSGEIKDNSKKKKYLRWN
jgi:transposase